MVGRIAYQFLVTCHPRIEHDFADDVARVPEAFSGINAAVFQQQIRQTANSPELHKKTGSPAKRGDPVWNSVIFRALYHKGTRECNANILFFSLRFPRGKTGPAAIHSLFEPHKAGVVYEIVHTVEEQYAVDAVLLHKFYKALLVVPRVHHVDLAVVLREERHENVGVAVLYQ